MNYTLEKRKPPVAQVSPGIQKANSPALQRLISPSVQKANSPVVQKNQRGRYTDEEIRALLCDGYILVHSQLWDYIPPGAHIRYVCKDTNGTSARGERFKPGAFVRNHFTTREGIKMLMLETKPGGKKRDAGYFSYPIAFGEIEELWKKYDRGSFIEIHLIHNSLAQKKQQIETLEARIQRLEDILRSLVKK